jgi:hypothetical protein
LKDQDQHQPGAAGLKPETSENQQNPATKRPFIEPEISQPVDVLEATTFFQSVESGATN